MAIFGQSNGDFSTNLIIQADKVKASDIHLDPYRDKFLVRFRIFGLLEVVGEYPKEDHDNVVRKLKVLVQLNIAESRIPQQARGQLQDTATGHMIDFRVSTFPTVFGEAAVIHMIDQKKEIFEDFESLGMNPAEVDVMKTAISRPYGMILVVGPAGSGKASTLYTALNQIRSPEKNIVTLEDPVEFELEFVRHSQIRPDVGFTFAEGMKAVLRQDPDVVFIGEILDHETAEIAVRAALSGRLVFSNISTNDSVGTITRFLELGIPRSFLATTLLLMISKRLLRRNCEYCRLPYMPAEKFLKQFNYAGNEELPFRKGSGCDKCEQRGYSGQIPIFELFPVDKKIADLIMEGATNQDLLKTASAGKMRTLRDAALEHAVAGETTLEEAMSVT